MTVRNICRMVQGYGGIRGGEDNEFSLQLSGYVNLLQMLLRIGFKVTALHVNDETDLDVVISKGTIRVLTHTLYDGFIEAVVCDDSNIRGDHDVKPPRETPS